MGAFDMLRIANSSLGMHQTWLDSLANNIANVNTVKRDQRERLPGPDGPGRRARRTAAWTSPASREGDPEGRMEYAPDHPLADENGYVRAPDIDMASQMSQLVMAQRGFQASVQVTKDAQETYASALQIGRG